MGLLQDAAQDFKTVKASSVVVLAGALAVGWSGHVLYLKWIDTSSHVADAKLSQCQVDLERARDSMDKSAKAYSNCDAILSKRSPHS